MLLLCYWVIFSGLDENVKRALDVENTQASDMGAAFDGTKAGVTEEVWI